MGREREQRLSKWRHAGLKIEGRVYTVNLIERERLGDRSCRYCSLNRESSVDLLHDELERMADQGIGLQDDGLSSLVTSWIIFRPIACL